MSERRRSADASGCGACFAAVVLLGFVAAALISLAALVDPFSWLAPIDEVWAECDEDLGSPGDECALENRFPGFWWHAAVNLAYTALALVLTLVFAGGVGDLREKRVARFASAEAATEHAAARQLCLATGAALAAVALLPTVVALA